MAGKHLPQYLNVLQKWVNREPQAGWEIFELSQAIN